MDARHAPLRGLAHITDRTRNLLLRSGAVLAGLALIAVVGTIWRMRDIALHESRDQTASMAFVLAEQMTRSLQAIDIVLRNVGERVEKLDAGAPDELEKLLGTQEMNQVLREHVSQLPQVQALALLSSTGSLLNTSRAWPVPDIESREREYFQILHDQGGSNAVISKPVKNRLSGLWTLYLARRINAPDGRFLGVVVAAIDVAYLQALFESVHLPHSPMFLVVRDDGTVLVRFPDQQSPAGMKLFANSPWYHAIARGGGTFVSPGHLSGSPRIVSTQPLRGYPLGLDVSVAESEVLAPWRRDALLLGIASFLIIAYAFLLLRLHARQLRQVRLSEASLLRRNEELGQLSARLSASEAHLSQKSRQLHTTLSTMDQGLMMIDRAGRVAVCNDRALELLDVPRELMSAEPPFTEVLDYQWHANRSGREEASFEDFLRARTVFDRPFAHELRRPNGRVIEVRSVPLGDGGAVRTYTDITERKACEDRSLYFAQHDDLTRLVNRLAFKERLNQALVVAANDRRGLALFYLDLDRFKLINDRRGHGVGDALLVEAARRVQAVVRSIDTVARIGGDEFTIILPYLEEHDSAARLAERLIDALNSPFVIEGVPATIGVSIGIAFFPQHALAAEALIARADEALYAAKSAGRNTFRFARGGENPGAPPGREADSSTRAPSAAS